MRDFERLSASERLLNREQVDALDNLDDLIAIQDAVMEAAKVIEVDLEFRSDDAADDEWERRARRALAAHYTCNGHITRRINFLRRGGRAPKQGGDEAKARRKEAAAQLELAQAEHKRLRAAENREKTARLMVGYAAKQSLLAFFHLAVVEEVGKQKAGIIMVRAKQLLESSMIADHPCESDESPLIDPSNADAHAE